ncbi:hypothetical protein [Granulicoccus sp. GXG6511]|uniref:hypothetical protein n=1 Tax=Granulicoccus sp. GXG6511 TaxID=3381351 RepID=UPI003D7C5084
MSSDRPEQDPQEWPTYPGMPSGQGPRPGQPQRPYANPDPQADEAFQAYQDYARTRPDQQHQQMQPQAPYQQRPTGQGSTWMQNKWTWIIAGIIGVFIITGLAQGDFPFLPVIFAIVIWQVLRHRRR